MYYVIKKINTQPLQHFIGFMVDKYIASKNTQTVIFEFKKDGKTQRKWIKREDIILLTDNKDYFLKIMKRFKATENAQQKLVDEARKQLDRSIEDFETAINEEFEKFEEIKNESDITCILSDY